MEHCHVWSQNYEVIQLAEQHAIVTDITACVYFSSITRMIFSENTKLF